MPSATKGRDPPSPRWRRTGGGSKPQRGEIPQPRATPWVPRAPMTRASPARSSLKLFPDQKSEINNQQSSISPASPASSASSASSASPNAKTSDPDLPKPAVAPVWHGRRQSPAPPRGCPTTASKLPADSPRLGSIAPNLSIPQLLSRPNLQPWHPETRLLAFTPCPPSTRPSNDSTT